jgi:hypothetical protein
MTKKEIVLVIFIAAIGFFICLRAVLSGPEPKPPEAKQNIYITRTDHVLTFDGSEAWILEYTVNGEMQAAMFNSPEALAEYGEYLDTIGRVYRREDTNGQE